MTIAKSPDDNRAFEHNRGRPLGVYIHFPWCLSKCPYCDFFSVATQSGIPHEQYADAIIAEFDLRMGKLDSSRLRSLYFGGGTPSLWEPSAVARVVSHVLGACHLRPPELEITLECNPSSFEISRSKAWLESGINRLSLGLQSLDPEHLKFLGRAHDANDAMRALDHALCSGFSNVGADLIFGLPEQPPSHAVAQVRRLPLAQLSHLSVYALTIEQNTQFGAMASAGRLPLAHDDDVVASFFSLHEVLGDAGFEHYEISNYAKPGCRAVHNSAYWQGQDYLGLGVAAYGTVHQRSNGTLERLRYRNTTRIAHYLEKSACQEALWNMHPEGILSDKEPISDSIAFTERIMLGLRTSDGVDLDALSRSFDVQTG